MNHNPIFFFSVESEAKAKTKVRFEEIFRHHAGLTDNKKSKKKKFHSQENIVVSLNTAKLCLVAFLSGKRPRKCIVERRYKQLNIYIYLIIIF